MDFTIPKKEQVSADNQIIFDNLQKGLGFVPNLYAYFGKNDTALAEYLALDGRKSTLSNKEKEAISLITSQINQCDYCLSAHTAVAKANGLTDEQIIQIRKGAAPFNEKLNALVQFTASWINNRGKASQEATESFFAAGYSEAAMIDVAMNIAMKTISNFVWGVSKVAVDFPMAEKI
jgi:uncharacterized peroxidase-related enzyme